MPIPVSHTVDIGCPGPWVPIAIGIFGVYVFFSVLYMIVKMLAMCGFLGGPRGEEKEASFRTWTDKSGDHDEEMDIGYTLSAAGEEMGRVRRWIIRARRRVRRWGG